MPTHEDRRLGVPPGMDLAHRPAVHRIRLVDDSSLVTHGLQSLIRADPSLCLVPQDGPQRLVDLTLYDCRRSGLSAAEGARRLRELTESGRVAVFTRQPTKALARWAVSQGAAGCLSKDLPGDRMIEALARLSRGLVADEGVQAEPHPPLPAREEDVLGLIASGLSNQEIATELFLSINSVKTYIRTLYRRIGVESRTQAVLWAVDRDVSRHQEPRPSEEEGPAAINSTQMARHPSAARLSVAPVFEDEPA